MIPHLSDAADKARALATYGPALGRCAGGRIIVPGYVCPHCGSGDPKGVCHAPADGGEDTGMIEPKRDVTFVPKPATESKTYEMTARLRWVRVESITPDRKLITEGRELQQAWICRETGEIKWEKVPFDATA